MAEDFTHEDLINGIKKSLKKHNDLASEYSRCTDPERKNQIQKIWKKEETFRADLKERLRELEEREK